jgi:hypothetical protein
MRYGSAITGINNIKVGVPQGEILSPIIYYIFVSDKPVTLNTSVADYAGYKVIIPINDDPILASKNHQIHLESMDDWYIKW